MSRDDSDRISLLALGSVLIRWRWRIIALGIIGGLIGLTLGLTSTRVYKSEATFIPQGSENANASAIASQFGLRMPTTGSTWGPPVYVELLHSRALLEQIANEPFTVAEKGGKRYLLADLWRINGPTPVERLNYTVQRLEQVLLVNEDKKLAAVRVSVTTPWPSVSLELVQRALNGLNTFNVQTRKSQAAAERQFAEAQAADAEVALREAEDREQAFLQENHSIIGSPSLTLQRDRLAREVALRQQLYTSLLQSREEARLREVRETPVFTVIEEPRLATVGEPRNSVKKAVLGGLTWGVLGVLLALLSEAFAGLRRAQSEDAQEFFQLVRQVTPRFLVKRR